MRSNYGFGGLKTMNENKTYPKNCAECYKNKTCHSWYGGCGCTEAYMTIFGTQEHRRKVLENNEKN